MNYTLPMIKYTIILQGNIIFSILIKDVPMFTQEALVIISPRIWNAVQTNIDVNVSIVKFKSMSKLYFMEHNLKIIYTKKEYKM